MAPLLPLATPLLLVIIKNTIVKPYSHYIIISLLTLYNINKIVFLWPLFFKNSITVALSCGWFGIQAFGAWYTLKRNQVPILRKRFFITSRPKKKSPNFTPVISIVGNWNTNVCCTTTRCIVLDCQPFAFKIAI